MRFIYLLLALFAVPASAQTFTDASGRLLTGPKAGLTVFGASLADVNLDGLPDLYQSGRLFLQNASDQLYDVLDGPRFGQPDGGTVFGAVFADGDGDGFPDMFVEDFDPGSKYFTNRFGIRWDLVEGSGPDMSTAQSQGASWADYDNDGDLDIFVGEEFGKNRYFENLGGGVFRDTGQGALQNEQHSYGVAANDYDRDGDLDVFIAACSVVSAAWSVNVLFRNEGNGTFVDVAGMAGVADSLAGWAVGWLDYDRDSWPDVFVANMPVGGMNARPGYNKLYRNLGDGTFEDVSEASGVQGTPDQGAFGASVADFDNDGWEDIYVANGIGEHQLLRNQGDGTFKDILPGLGLLPINPSIAVAVGDLDADGAIDIFTPSRSGNRLFMNNGVSNHYLSVSLRGQIGNIQGIGARVTAHVEGALLQRTISAGDGMTSQNHNTMAHFGLGSISIVDTLIVEWPGGFTSRYYDVPADQQLHIERTTGLNGPPGVPVLTGPATGSILDQHVSFSWDGVTDPDGDPVTYTLAVLSLNDRTETGEMVISGISATTVEADLGSITDGDYVWTVVAEDGFWTRGATNSYTFRKGGVVDIEEGPQLLEIQIFPNPVSSWATITLHWPGAGSDFYATDAARIVIVDVLGRSVASFKPDGTDTRLDLSGLAPGVYLVRAGMHGRGLPLVVSR